MIIALKVFGIGALISYGIAVLMKVTMACIGVFILDYSLGANICGVITTAILTGIYITLLS